MINNIKELIKSRSENETISNKLDQEVLITYKMKISQLENENNKTQEEFNSIKRNFEALCLKNKEDTNLIKKLESELIFLKNKIKSLEMTISSSRINEDDEIIKTYKEKIDSLNNIIKNLENKINSNNLSVTKFQEKEAFFKNYISKLEEKNKLFTINQETIDKENNKLKKEIKKIEDKYNNAEKTIENKNEEIENLKLNSMTDKLQKEKDLIEKLLYESREKIKIIEGKYLELTAKLKEKDLIITNYDNEVYRLENLNENLNKDLEAYKLELNNLKKDNNSLTENKEEILKLNSDIEFLNKEIMNYKTKEDDYIKDIHNLEIKNIKLNNKLLLEIENISTNFKSLIVDYENNFSSKLLEIEKVFENKILVIRDKVKRIDTFMNSIIKDNNYKKTKNNIILKDLESENNFYKENNKKLDETIKKLKYDLDSSKFTIVDNEKKVKVIIDHLNKKLENKRNKIYSLRNQNENYENELNKMKNVNLIKKDVEVNTEDYNEDKEKLKLNIVSMREKIKLSIDTIILILSCKSCNEGSSNLKNDLEVMKCGHSICKMCIKRNNNCYECGSLSNSFAQNIKLNDLILRVTFLTQMYSELDQFVNIYY